MSLDRFERGARMAFCFLEDDFAFTCTVSTEHQTRFVTYTGGRAFVRLDAESRERD